MIPLPRLLDSNLNEIRRIRPISVSITEDIVPLSTASMRLMPGDSVPYRSYVELFTPNGSAGVYRAKMPTERYGNPDNSVNLEHAICELGDYIVKGTIEQEVKTLAQAVTQVFGYYGGSRWQLGAVNVTADVLISADYSNVLQTINSLIEQAPGAMMAFDFSTNPWTFSIVAVEGSVSAEGRLSRNVASAEISRNDSELCTRVWLNHIASTAEQSYMDADTIGTYGVIERVLTDRNYTTPQAQQVASKYLAKHKNPTYSVQIDGLDLSSITGESLDRFAIGKKFRLTIPEDQQKIEETIVNLSWYDVYESPTAVRVTLSEHAETETSIIGNLSSEVYGTKADSTRSRTYLNQTDYKIELVAEQVEDVESELDNKYTIRSGIEIEPEGVTISGSKFLKIESGGTFDVDSNNFKISSVNKSMTCGANTFDEKGLTYTSNNRLIRFGKLSDIDANVMSGVFCELNDSEQIGRTIIYASPFNKNSSCKLVLECAKFDNENKYYAKIYPSRENATYPIWGGRNNPMGEAYLNEFVSGKQTYETAGIQYKGGWYVFRFDSEWDYDQTKGKHASAYIRTDYSEKEPDTIHLYASYKTSENPLMYALGKLRIHANVDVTTCTTYLGYTYVSTLEYNSLVQNSSRDIKHNITDLPPVGEKLDQLRPVTFVYDDDETEKQRIGMIYEDTVEVMPEICTDDESHKAINYVELIPALLKEIQDLRARVAELERRAN